MAQILTVGSDELNRGAGQDDIDAVGTVITDTSLEFLNDGFIRAYFSNGSAAPRTATLQVRAGGDPFGQGVGDTVIITIPIGGVGYFSFMNPAIYNTGGIATITVDSADPAFKALLVRQRKQ